MEIPEIQTEQEQVMLEALATMALQYLTVTTADNAYLDSLAMSAGEGAIEVLASYGMVDADDSFRSATWTTKGESLLSGA